MQQYGNINLSVISKYPKIKLITFIEGLTVIFDFDNYCDYNNRILPYKKEHVKKQKKKKKKNKREKNISK